ncbi:MAG: ATP-binding protein [Armatimonadota bacterium]
MLYSNGQRIGQQCEEVEVFEHRTGLGGMVVLDTWTPANISARLQEPADVLPRLYPWLRDPDAQNSLVIDSSQYVVPADPLGSRLLRERIVLDTLGRWARDTALRRRGGCLVLLCPRLGDIPADLIQGDGIFTVIPVEYPTAQERYQLLVGFGLSDDEAALAANTTTGFRRIELEEVARRRMTAEDVARMKGRMITARCGDTLELVDSPHGLDRANAQPHVKRYLEGLREEVLRDRSSPIIPMGLLFVGVPGNGKSHLARAFAHDCGMNMLRLKNIRSMWVGQSERNLETVLDLLPSLAPSVVFLDEVDQLLGSRAHAPAHDGGVRVDERLLGRLLEFMGDPNHRGEIIWIGATNRPDLLDVAALRRFDRIFPFMNPTDEARVELIRDLLGQLKIPVAQDFDPKRAAASMGEYSCDEVEKVIRRSWETARRANQQSVTTDLVIQTAGLYEHNYDPLMHELVALLSIQATNFRCDLPWFDENGNLLHTKLPSFLQALADGSGGLDRRSLAARVTQLRQLIRSR